MSTETEIPLAKWREIGHDEVIQEGDEVGSYPAGTYVAVGHPYIGKPVSSSSRRFRTRRPLPEEIKTEAETPRADVCPFCGAIENIRLAKRFKTTIVLGFNCGTKVLNIGTNRDPLCREREARQKAEAEVERLRSQSPTPVWPEIVRLQGKIAELEGQLLSARNDSFNLANALSASEKKLEVAHKQLKNYTNAIETL